MRRESTIRWTGDNRDELISFYPYILDLGYDYKDWPGIQAIGAKNLISGSTIEIPMRAKLVKIDKKFVYMWQDPDETEEAARLCPLMAL